MTTYTKQQWADGQTNAPYGPISGARLSYMETGIAAAMVAPPASYTLELSGSNVLAHGTGPLADFSDPDGGVVLQSVITALGVNGGRVFLRAGTYPWSSVPLIPPGITGKLHIQGEAGATVQLSTAGPRLLDLNRTADYQTFQNIEVSDLVVDCNNVLGTSHNHIIIGTLAAGSYLRRVNLDRISVRRCRTINVPTNDTQSRMSVLLASSHVASGETQTTITNILVDDCDFSGGNVGVAISGTGTATAGQGVNVYLDNIIIQRIRHDTLVVPTGTNTIQANFQIGGLGHGGMVRMADCYAANSSDVGYEIDGIQDFTARGCVAVDSWNTKFFSRNFRPPVSVSAQINTWDSCYARNVNLDRATRVSTDYGLGGDAATAGYIFGELAIVNGHCSDDKTTMPNTIGLLLNASNQFHRLTVRGLSAVYTALAVSAGANSPVFFDCRSQLGDAVYDIDGLTFVLTGVRTNAGSNTWKMTRIAGATPTLRLSNLVIDGAGLSGASSATDTFYWVGLGLDFTTTMRVFVDGVTAKTSPPGTHNVVAFRDPQLTIGGTRAYVGRLNIAKLPAGQGFDIQFGNATQKAQTMIHSILGVRSGGGSGPITAPTALTGLVNATGVTVGSVSAGVPCIVQFVQGSGSGITAIDFSTNGGTTYTNLLTQAAGAMPAGADMVLGPVLPETLIKATFTTTQPTISLVPVGL